MKETFPTCEEYNSASKFARFRFKYGLFVLIACWICLVLIIVYMIVYAKELSTHPAIYTIEKLGVNDCYCYGEGITYHINKTSITYTNDFVRIIPNLLG